MKSLPLFYHPSKWLLVDDDPSFLNILTQVLGEKNQLLTFNSSLKCAAYLKNYQPCLSKQNFLKSNTSNEDHGYLKHTPLDFDVTDIVGLRSNAERYNEITVMVTDYNMPEMDGLALAQMARDLPIEKILLTGEVKQAQTIAAFNKELIQRFIQKGEEKIEVKLSNYLQELSLRYFEKISEPLLSCLETEVKLPLSDPLFIAFFEDYCHRNHIKEYYLIDKQGSFLCVNAQDQETCLVLQTERGLDTWLADYDDGSSFSDEILTAVNDRKKIPFFGIGKEAWEVPADQWQQHFFSPKLLAGREKYYWAQVSIANNQLLPAE